MEIQADIIRLIDHSFIFDIFRGDGFQAVTQDIQISFYLMLLFKAGLRRHNSLKGRNTLENVLDARIALGIGTIDHDRKRSLSQMTGEAFVKSGRSLEKMKSEGRSIMINTGEAELDSEFEVVSPLIEALTSRWTSVQAEAVYIYLLQKPTQEVLGKRLNISQRAVGKRLKGSNIELILAYEERFRERVKWKYKL